MQTVTTIGLDIAKSVFQIHGVDAKGDVVAQRALRHILIFGVLFMVTSRIWPFWNGVSYLGLTTKNISPSIGKTLSPIKSNFAATYFHDCGYMKVNGVRIGTK